MALRLIQLGLGGWGRNWVAEVTRDLPAVEPVAWVDQDPAAREQAIRELGLPPDRVFPTLADALRTCAADAALVVVPLAAHADAVRNALDHGLHVLVEKPFTEDLDSARTLVASARDRDRVLMVSQNYRWFAAPRAARRLLRDGAIGELRAVYLDFYFLYGADYRYFFLAQPLLSDMAIHHFDALRFVLDDEPVEVSCHTWSEPGAPFAGPPAGSATIQFRRGTLVSYRGSWISRGLATPYGGNWRLDGTAGSIVFGYRGAGAEREVVDDFTIRSADGSTTSLDAPELPLKDRMGSLDAFAGWVRTGRIPDGISSAADNLASLALMFGAIRSAETGGAVVPIEPGAVGETG